MCALLAIGTDLAKTWPPSPDPGRRHVPPARPRRRPAIGRGPRLRPAGPGAAARGRPFQPEHQADRDRARLLRRAAGQTGVNFQVSFNPVDQIGLQAADALRHLRTGAFDGMAVLIGQVARDEPFFEGLDLIGVSTNVADLAKAVDAGRESFDKRLQERFNAKVMALWPFGPQYFFCNAPVKGVADLK